MSGLCYCAFLSFAKVASTSVSLLGGQLSPDKVANGATSQHPSDLKGRFFQLRNPKVVGG